MNEIKKYTCKCESCNREFDEEEYEITQDKNKCILHCEKDDWYLDTTGKKWNVKYLIYFWKNLKEKTENEMSIAKAKNPKLIKYNFEEVNLIEMIFPFINYENFNFFKELGIKKINFIKCKFKEAITYSNFENVEKLSFKETHFYKNVIFSNENILKEVEFINCKFHKNFNISSTTFNESANFTQSEFKEVEFNSTIFKKGVFFNQTIFSNEIDLQMTFFYEKVNFYNIKYKSVSNRETARIIKDSFEQQNNIIEANKFYALEMKEMENELKFFKKPFEWFVFKIHGIASNHSQDFLLALFWILNITFVTVFLQFELVCENSFVKLFDRFFFFFGGLIFLGYGISKLKENFKNIAIILFSIISYFIYSNTYIDDSSLKLFSNTLNPFSIMTGKEELSFGILLYKITIAYLIYQLIISIRQNTRRK